MKYMKRWIMSYSITRCATDNRNIAEFVRVRAGDWPRSRIYRDLTDASLARLERAFNDAAYFQIELSSDSLTVQAWSF